MIRYICAQPATLYYAWQVEVMLQNFERNGINLNQIDIVCSEGEDSNEFQKLKKHYNARFFFYKDLRKTSFYTSSIRPNILKQHFKEHTELSNDVIFYHDCDILFSKPVDFSKFLDDNIWYGSDVESYIGYDYIISKGEDVINLMCEIIDIDKSIIKLNQKNTIGAQYILKNIDYVFWDEVEYYSELLFQKISILNGTKIKNDKNYHPLQIWCADMWVILWLAWKQNIQTVNHPDFNFTWAVDTISLWDKNPIYHNAGVVSDENGNFYKAKYINKLPYNQVENIKNERANYMYWKEIQKTAQSSILL